ncbi:hypothetical protein Bca4012_064983 [Brassica carinata]
MSKTQILCPPVSPLSQLLDTLRSQTQIIGSPPQASSHHCDLHHVLIYYRSISSLASVVTSSPP